MKTNRKNIAFVSDAIWPYNKGGKEKRLFDISTRLCEKGYDIHIYTMKWWKGEDVIKENGLTLHAISKLYPLYSGQRRSIKEGIMFGLSCLKLIKYDWDVIDVDHMPYFPLYSTKLVCLLKGKKMYATWHEVWGKEYWVKYMGKLGIVSYLVERLSTYLPDKIISISELTTNKLKNEFLSKKEIITIPAGIDYEYIQKIKPSLIKSDVIYIGRLLSHKNIDILIRSVALLKKTNPKIKCLIVGEGPEKDKLVKLVKRLHLTRNVTLFGRIEDHEEVLSLIKSSRVFVLPSRREGFGIVVIESNACGIPVITTNNKDNASKYLIKKGVNGYICRLDEKEIANSISEVIEKVIYRKPEQIIINFAQKYDWYLLINKIENAYQAR
jgi:L-malate glycosyltransferase